MTAEFQCVSRGEVWLMAWDSPEVASDGIEPVLLYPVLVISTDLQANNPHFSDVVIVPCDLVDASLPKQLYVAINPSDENRLPYPIQVEIHVFHTIPKSLLRERIGRLTHSEMELIGSKIKMVLDLD
ncbi:MAG: type II toxin-antitoxin system PemK/MazF family toxin [Armatimonadota bacterium]